MTIHVLGSVNIDYVYRVPNLPQPGETLAGLSRAVHLGGKGANQAIAAARAGAPVRFIGAIGPGDDWTRDRLAAAGVDVSCVAEVEEATGHAIIYVDAAGENCIVIHGGANRAIPEAVVEAALAQAQAGDWWLTQNETSGVTEAAARAQSRGLRTVHVAAPFVPEDALPVLPHTDLLAVNEGEAAALASRLGGAVPVDVMLVTRGAAGAAWRERPTVPDGAGELSVPAFAVTAVDTTGAGDCFLGYALAGLHAGLTPEVALRRAAAAAALSVTREGAADAIPEAAEVDAFLAERS
ncbi:MAG: PfkB family carbohydrate kinase [Pseudomonadota bacterium]